MDSVVCTADTGLPVFYKRDNHDNCDLNVAIGPCAWGGGDDECLPVCANADSGNSLDEINNKRAMPNSVGWVSYFCKTGAGAPAIPSRGGKCAKGWVSYLSKFDSDAHAYTMERASRRTNRDQDTRGWIPYLSSDEERVLQAPFVNKPYTRNCNGWVGYLTSNAPVEKDIYKKAAPRENNKPNSSGWVSIFATPTPNDTDKDGGRATIPETRDNPVTEAISGDDSATSGNVRTSIRAQETSVADKSGDEERMLYTSKSSFTCGQMVFVKIHGWKSYRYEYSHSYLLDAEEMCVLRFVKSIRKTKKVDTRDANVPASLVSIIE